MQNKLLIFLMLISSYCFGQSVPDQLPVKLIDVYNAVHAHTPSTTFSLVSCHANAIPAYFNPTYNQVSYSPDGGLLRFRDYKPTGGGTQGTIYAATNITSTSAAHDCDWDGNGYTMTGGGVVCNTTTNPTTSTYAKLSDATAFLSGFTFRSGGIIWAGLTPNTTYYARAYVITSQGTFYSNQVSFTTLP